MKRILPDIIAIVVFVVIALAYFAPAVFEGRVLFQHDTQAGAGMSKEIKDYYEQTGERSRWTNALFGGMPTYQISPSYNSTQPLEYVQDVYSLFLPDYVWYIFVLMLGFFILLRAMGVSPWLSTIGGIVWAFSSYFFILISAGHIWKLIALAYVPPTIAGMMLAYRKKYLLGGIITVLFVALQIRANHIQMSYYFGFVMLCIFIAFLVDAFRKKELSTFMKSTAVIVFAGILGVLVNGSTLYHTYEYSQETMRGKSELVQQNAQKAGSNGLEKAYITQWSYGIGETFSLLVPNVKGGASVPLGQNETAMKKANPVYSSLYGQIGQYWGEQPGTSGPVYVGAFVLMLFILGLFIVKGPIKWALLAATVLSITLSWGHNFMGLTDFFIDHVPMYNKFRAVSSILVIAEFTIPLLAILALKELIDKPQLFRERAKAFYISFGLTAGFALLFAIAPRFFFPTYISSGEMQMLSAGLPAEHLAPFVSSLQDMRVAIFTADAWRSFFIVLIGALLVFLYGIGKLKSTVMLAGVGLLCLVEMWDVNKRYLHDDQFIEPSTTGFTPTQADKEILADKTLNFRVLNMTSNTFNENATSYYHKSVGGYHAAKLGRYQELIENYIGTQMSAAQNEIIEAQGMMEEVNPEAFAVLNMLNTRYFILRGGDNQPVPVQNPYAFGNAWFTDKVLYVPNANQEMAALGQVDLATTAVVDERFKPVLNNATAGERDSLASVMLVDYAPNKLVYAANSEQGGVVVFSEIYYPKGWTATIDGQPAEIGRANYVLRAMYVPAGEHTIEMRFDPTSLKVTETVAYIALALLIIGVMALLWQQRKRLGKGEE